MRVTVSTGARQAFDEVLAVVTKAAGLTGQVVVRHASPSDTVRDFCRSAPNSPDMVLTTYMLRGALAAECNKNYPEGIAEVELARAGLVLAVRSGSELAALTSRQVYLALAREVPYRDEFTRNTAVRWADVDPELPGQDIRFQLPMREEGSRTTFDTLVLQDGCRNESAVKKVFDARQRTVRCTTARSDRVRELPRAQAVKALLEAPLGTVGVLTRHELTQAGGQLVGLTLDDIPPDAAPGGLNDFSVSFWLYAKRGRPRADAILQQMQSDAVIGPEGPLPKFGLSPLGASERAAQRVELATGYGVGTMLSWLTVSMLDAWRMVGIGPGQPAPPPANGVDFTTLMDIAGYQIASVQSSIGIIPDASMTFDIAREMSEADQLYLERILHRDSLARPGPLAALQRWVVRSILDVREVGGFEVSKVDIVFLPLPGVTLTATPKGRGGDDAE